MEKQQPAMQITLKLKSSLIIKKIELTSSLLQEIKLSVYDIDDKAILEEETIGEKIKHGHWS